MGALEILFIIITIILPPVPVSRPSRSGRSSGEQQRTVADDWELPHSCMQVGRVLGAGAFGQVLLGRVSRAYLRHRELPPKFSSLDGEGGGPDGDPLTALVAIKMLKGGWWWGGEGGGRK